MTLIDDLRLYATPKRDELDAVMLEAADRIEALESAATTYAREIERLEREVADLTHIPKPTGRVKELVRFLWLEFPDCQEAREAADLLESLNKEASISMVEIENLRRENADLSHDIAQYVGCAAESEMAKRIEQLEAALQEIIDMSPRVAKDIACRALEEGKE